MEQPVHIRLSGHADTFLLTPTARDLLLGYLADARAALTPDPAGDQTIRDLEVSIGQQLRSLADRTGGPIDDAQMAHVLAQAGAVESPQSFDTSTIRSPRGAFWCRIDQGKWFGGICLGIAARGQFNVDWVRTIVFFLLLLTGGLLGPIYLALLLILPRVETVAEYQRLRDSPKSLG